MGATYTPVRQDVFGSQRISVVDVTGDAAYPTGGYAPTPGDVGLQNIDGALQIGGNPASALLKAHWDTTNKKTMFVYPTGGAGAAPAALGAPTATPAAGATAVNSTAAQPAIPINPGEGAEVANNTDLSTITVRMMFFGN